MEYYIWCHERDMWWGKNRRGYTDDIRDAGKYPQEEAIEICNKANHTHVLEESMVPVEGFQNS